MVSFRRVTVAVGAILIATVVDGCPSPVARRMTTTTTSTTTMSSLMNSIVLNLPRGGELHEPTSLNAVQSFVTSAGINNKLVVIDFTATWCGPCQQIAPLYKSLSEENTNGVVFLKVDVDTNQETAMHYEVQAMPTFVLIKGGQVVDTIQGADISSLRAAIQKHQ
mmetsp:Transcript_24149/g.26931  ORF Transcript_24149/g.26931 Transcript_24149/m.26931 type:complete len:165 (+) Transcript_24149:82-576(+)